VEPPDTAVTKPAPFTEATAGLELLHEPPVTVELNTVENPVHKFRLPVITPAEMPVLTVTAMMAVESRQGAVPKTVYLIFTVPSETAVTNPAALTVATAGLLLLQLPPLTVEENWAVAPKQIVCEPLKTPGDGRAATETTRVALAEGQPADPKIV